MGLLNVAAACLLLWLCLSDYKNKVPCNFLMIQICISAVRESFFSNPKNKNLVNHSSSTEALSNEVEATGNDGRRRRYRAGPKNGISDSGSSHEPLPSHFRAVMSL